MMQKGIRTSQSGGDCDCHVEPHGIGHWCGSHLRGSLSRSKVMIASKESNLMTYQGVQVRAEEMGITRRWAAWEKCSAEGHYLGTTATNPPLRYCQRCFTAWSWRSDSDLPLNEPIRQTVMTSNLPDDGAST